MENVTNKEDVLRNQSENNDNEKDKKLNKKLKVIIALLIIIIIIILLMRSCGGCNEASQVITPTITPTEGGTASPTNPAGDGSLKFEDGEIWDGNSETIFEEKKEEEIEYTTFPGLTKIVVNKENQEIQLYNYPENTVYFVYTITNAETNEIIHQTYNIAPGKYVKWNVYQAFEEGEHEVFIEISTKDVVTHETCYGVRNRVSVTVNK